MLLERLLIDMNNLCYISLIFFLCSANALNGAENKLTNYLSSDGSSPSSTYWKREAGSGNSNSGNPFGNYVPSAFTPPIDLQPYQKCYEIALAHLQESGSFPGIGGQDGSRYKDEQNSSNSFASLMSNEQFREIFDKCMADQKPPSSAYKKREADSGNSNPFGNYIPSGFSPPFGTQYLQGWEECFKYAKEQWQGSGSGSRGDGDKEEETTTTGSSSSSSFGSMISNEQFQEIFNKCMAGQKPPSSAYKKREADSGNSNPFGSYIPSGFSPPFGTQYLQGWEECFKYAQEQWQGSGSGSRGDGDKEEETTTTGSSSSSSFGSMISNEQFQEIFNKCMAGQKPPSSAYKKREADSGNSNPFGTYIPSGFSPPFGTQYLQGWEECFKYAQEQWQGSGSGSRGDGDKEEETTTTGSSSSSNFGSMISNEQFQEIFNKCMAGQKPPSSAYKKREADSGNSNPFGSYIPSGFSPPFGTQYLQGWEECFKYAQEQWQGSGSGSRGDGDKEEETTTTGSSSSSSFGSMISNEQFQEIFNKCMAGQKPPSSAYKKREADSGNSNPFGTYIPSGFSPPFGTQYLQGWEECFKYAQEQWQGSGSGSRGDGDKEEETTTTGSSSSSSFGSMISNEQFQEIFNKCMAGQKPPSSAYKKREADSGNSNPFGTYIPSGFSPPFGTQYLQGWEECFKYAQEQWQGSGSGSRGDGDKEEETTTTGSSSSSSFGSMISNEQFQEIFNKCMAGQKPPSSAYKKREADSGNSNLFGNYIPSGFSPPFGTQYLQGWEECFKYAQEQWQGSGSGSRGDGDKEEETTTTGSSSSSFGSMISNEQFQEIFNKCMAGQKPSSSAYKKREADSGNSNLFGNYIPSGFSPPFGTQYLQGWEECFKYAQEQWQGSGSGSRGDGDKEEETTTTGSSSSSSFGSMISNEQFQEIFNKCMAGQKPPSSAYKKREADSGNSNPFGNYIPSGFSPPFGTQYLQGWEECFKYAQEQWKGSGSGSRGDGDKEEETTTTGSSSSSSFGSMISNEQFQEIFNKCMAGQKPSSSAYKKREADSGNSNPFGSYIPSGFSPPFGTQYLQGWEECFKYAQEQWQGSGSGSRGDGDKEEETTTTGSSSSSFGSMISNEQFQEIFNKCMAGQKPPSSAYKKREANLKRRVKKSGCTGEQNERSNVFRHISLFY